MVGVNTITAVGRKDGGMLRNNLKIILVAISAVRLPEFQLTSPTTGSGSSSKKQVIDISVPSSLLHLKRLWKLFWIFASTSECGCKTATMLGFEDVKMLASLLPNLAQLARSAPK
jgi:hypothetical protein